MGLDAMPARVQPMRASAGLTPAQAAVDWLGRGDRSASILATVQQLMRAQRVVRRCLPGAMGAACQVALIDGHTMTIVVPSAAHAAKLRQMTPAICRELGRKGWAITDIRIKITLRAAPVAEAPVRHGVALNAQGLQAFAALESTLPPGPLADAVRRLLEHHRST